MGLETVGEGTVFSTPTFLRHGFVVIAWTNMVFQRQNPSDD